METRYIETEPRAIEDPAYNRSWQDVPDPETLLEDPEVNDLLARFLDLDTDKQMMVTAGMLQILTAHCGRMAAAKGFHDPEVGQTIDRRLLLAVGELVEAQDELRDGHAVDEVRQREKDGKPEGFVMELADVIIRVLDLAYAEGLDIGSAVVTKFFFNATRPTRHGKAF